jgi:hypothetical protein
MFPSTNNNNLDTKLFLLFEVKEKYTGKILGQAQF